MLRLFAANPVPALSPSGQEHFCLCRGLTIAKSSNSSLSAIVNSSISINDHQIADFLYNHGTAQGNLYKLSIALTIRSLDPLQSDASPLYFV